MAFSLSDYTDMQELRRGGMARVYVATQVSLNRKVVIKEMLTEESAAAHSQDPADDSLYRRFENEARAAAALDHDNIIRVYDFGVDNRTFYIAMEYVDGADLDDLLKRTAFPPEVGLMIALQALKGLHHSHESGIIHRDVKPANILVSRTGRVKVVDFGLAYAAEGATRLTRTDAVVGTPHFLAPEQVIGTTKRDKSMDIWAVGVLLYRVVSGKLPFEGDNLPGIVYSIVHTTETPVQKAAPWVRESLATVVRDCLQKDPAKRPGTLEPVIAVLQEYLFDAGVRDPADEIRKYLAGQSYAGEGLSRRLVVQRGRISGLVRRDDGEKKPGAPWSSFLPIGGALACIVIILVLLGQRRHVTTPPPPAPKATVFKATTAEPKPKDSGDLQESPQASPAPTAAPQPTSPSTRPAPAAVSPAPSPRPPRTSPEAKVDALPPVKGQPAAGPVETARPAGPPPFSSPRRQLPAAESGQQAAAMGTLKLSVFPPTAEAFVDNQPLSATEMMNGKQLTPGVHSLVVRADGYRSGQRAVPISANTTLSISVELKPARNETGGLTVLSFPRAEVYVDGVLYGETPIETPLEFTVGTHRVSVRRSGFKEYQQTVEIRKDAVERIKVRLEK